MAMRDDLLERARRVAHRRELSLSQLGRLIVGDHKFFTHLATGGDCTTQRYERATGGLDRLEKEDAGARAETAVRKGRAA